MDMREMFTIDGRRFSNMAGFGRHEYGQPIRIKWLAYEKSVRDLGKETMDTITEIILDTDHSGHDCTLERL
jgi:hypothetical protein